MDLVGLEEAIFLRSQHDFDSLAMEVFKYQSENCQVYAQYLAHLQIDKAKISNVGEIPYLPIAFFKDFEIKSSVFNAEIIFESSSTTGVGVSRHFVKDLNLYRRAFSGSFNFFFNDFKQYCHLALLPSYLERQNSSLVAQVEHFIQTSIYNQSAFYLHNVSALLEALQQNEKNKIPTILWGVTYALLDFIEQYQLTLKYTIVIETGGMKGKRKEITRDELHEQLKSALQLETIAGEYGMTELMSQAYAVKDGRYVCPPWMRVTAREINDPLGQAIINRHGAINVIDLANLHTCAFIATSDLGKVYQDRSFEILGRIDFSDTRGCNLLV